MDPKELSPLEASRLDIKQTIFVDVRMQSEFAQKRIDLPVALAPLADLNPKAFAITHGILQDTPMVIFCASGGRAKRAAAQFIEAGFTNVQIMQGGLSAWEQAGLPLISKVATSAPGGPISMERQVRIVAGLLVLVFVLLGCFIHPAFAAVTFFIGAGQVFSGITNTCGMAAMLALAPWNKSGCSGGSCAIGGAGKNPGASCQ